MLGYLYGAPGLLSLGSATQVSLPASFGLLAAGAALVAANPDHDLVKMWGDRGIAGAVMRRIVPAASSSLVTGSPPMRRLTLACSLLIALAAPAAAATCGDPGALGTSRVMSITVWMPLRTPRSSSSIRSVAPATRRACAPFSARR